jgi:hypothetical protein
MSKELTQSLYKPFKIIYKYRNTNRKFQYFYYIFLGNIPNNIKKIISKFVNLSFIDTLLELAPDDIIILEKYYTIYWYESFFLIDHINTSKKVFNSNTEKTKQNNIIKKMGDEWIEKHIKTNKKSSLVYSYTGKIRIERLKKQVEDEKQINLSNLSGGSSIKIENKLDDISDDDVDDTNINELVEDDEVPESEPEVLQETVVEDYDVAELEEMHMINEDIDKDAEKTKNQLDKILEDEALRAKVRKERNIVFDTSNMNNNYSTDISDIIEKKVIYSQFIYPDDTILNMKKKICVTIEKNREFDTHAPYFIPSRIYTWVEYIYNNFNGSSYNEIRDNIMLGRNWLKQNNLLQLDIVPLENFHDYEILKGNIGTIKESMNRYGSRIHTEDNNHMILNDYSEYIYNNEVFFTDIYTELGLNYNPSPEVLANIRDYYVKIYFTESAIDFPQILDYLNKNKDTEIKKINQIITTTDNDLSLENTVMEYIEYEYSDKKEYDNYYINNFITQTTTHVALYITSINGKEINVNKDISVTSILKFNLHRIFENFILSEKYPYIQYQPPDAAGWHKFRTINPEYDRDSIQSKWLETNPYGISFKIKVDIKGGSYNKYISVKLSEYGRLEYKTQWKEEDGATFEDINNTFQYIQDLITKINDENNFFKIYVPKNNDFKFAFINNIQSFQLPRKTPITDKNKKDVKSYVIDHNDFSDFCRLFFPYISVVIHPRKRESKNKEKKNPEDELSKYGTYLRYKRVSNYHSEMNIERRIRYFLKNYEYDEKGMVKEISSQFNLTDQIAQQKIRETRDKYPFLKKARNILKKFENIPRAKPSGVEVDIQGKTVENYKIRISGARSQWQLNQILQLINVILYLYVDVYHHKNPDRKYMMETLKSLNNIAKRRNKVEIISELIEEVRTIKKMTKLDKDRLGFRPDKGQNHWSRNCQNSGTKKRQPTVHTSEVDLLANGYIYNQETKNYEKKVKINGKEVVLRTIKIPSEDKNIYYTCDLDTNKKYSYIGYLTKSKHPSGLCMPCCFKNDSFNTKNKNKKDINDKCANNGLMDSTTEVKNVKLDKIYILQETNKVQEGRYSFLPEYMDIFFNKLSNQNGIANDKSIKNHYLVQSKSGYFFKYGIGNQKIPYISAIASSLEVDYQELLDGAFKNIDDILFTCLMNGEIKLRFGDVETYKNYIYNGYGVTHEFLDDLICYIFNINTYIFEKRVSKRIDNETNQWIKYDDYILLCKNIENYNDYKTKKNVIIVKDDMIYFPVFNLQKDSAKKEKYMNVTKLHEFNDKEENNIINRVNKYYVLNCLQNTKLATSIFLTAREVKNKLNTGYTINGQVIDSRYKCRFLILNKSGSKTNFLFPVQPSGCLNKIPIYKNYVDFINTINTSMNFIDNINSLDIKVKGITYSQKIRDKYMVSGLYIQENIILPVTIVRMDETEIKKFAKEYKIKNFMIVTKKEDDIIDREILKGPENIIVDDRILKVNKVEYIEEGYARYRLELSELISNNSKIQTEIDTLCNEMNVTKVKEYILKITKQYNLIHLIPRIPKLDDYKITNFRQLCKLDKTCSHVHCGKSNNSKTCQLQMTDDILDQYIKRLSNEIVYNIIKRQEILKKYPYSVDDIYNYDYFTSKNNEKILKTSNLTIDSILKEIYGENNIPNIGKKRLINVNAETELYPPKIFGNKIEQLVKKDNGFYRSIINGLYWIKNPLLEVEYRNLGYDSTLQNDIINLFKGKIIQWLFEENNLQKLYSKFNIKQIPQLKEKLVSHDPLDSTYKYELFILSDILNYKINIVNQYDEKIMEYSPGNVSEIITVKHEIYNNIITKFFVIYNIE